MLTTRQKRPIEIIKTFIWGSVVVALYFSLYLYEQQIIKWTAQGEWTFIGPLTIAFVFSIAHGNFTAHFWDALGIKAKGGK